MSVFRPALASGIAFALLAATGVTIAQTGAPAKPGAKPATKAAPKAAPQPRKPAPKPAPKVAPKPVVELVLPDAPPEQVVSAEKVYYGVYDCEFKQTIHIASSLKHSAYVDVKHGKNVYVMKPVLSSTGAIRLEDVYGETLMVQISSKSMLLNVKTGQRVVDECISPKQRELVEAARAAKVAEAAAAAASAASAAATPAAAPSAPAASVAAPAASQAKS